MKQGTAIVGFILSFLAGMLVMWGLNQGTGLKKDSIKADASGAWSDAESPVPVTSKDPTWGSRTAPVTMVVFSEFECPFCSRVEGSLEAIKTEYGPEKIRVVWKSYPLPFHANARPASVAAETVRALAGNDAFWKFHKTAFANQKALNRENFEKWAADAGVDMVKFKDALDKNTYAEKVDADQKLGQSLGVRGTPHAFINGVVMNGAQPLDKFKEVVDAQLTAAKALADGGTKPDKVYVEATKKNFKPADKAAERGERPERAEDKNVWNVPVGKSPVKGAPDALVTLVIFSEYQCPFCKRVEPTLDQLMKDYAGKLRIVWKDRPLSFHADAEPAAMFVAEARKQKGDKGFWDAHNLLFQNQPKFKMENFEEYAKTLGLNWAAVKKAIETKAHAASIAADVELAESLRASGTPHMFINGRRLSGAQPIDSFKKVIDEELAKAEALVKAGTPAKAVYDEIMKKAQTPAAKK